MLVLDFGLVFLFVVGLRNYFLLVIVLVRFGVRMSTASAFIAFVVTVYITFSASAFATPKPWKVVPPSRFGWIIVWLGVHPTWFFRVFIIVILVV